MNYPSKKHFLSDDILQKSPSRVAQKTFLWKLPGSAMASCSFLPWADNGQLLLFSCATNRTHAHPFGEYFGQLGHRATEFLLFVNVSSPGNWQQE